MRSVFLRVLAAALLLALPGVTVGLAPIGCKSATAATPRTITVFFSNETFSQVLPCCRYHHMGGLSWRATVMAQQTANPELVVDVGNFSTQSPSDQAQVLQQTYLLRIYDMLGYSALNVGPQEFLLGKHKLAALWHEAGDRLISANVVDSTGQLVLPGYRIVDVNGLQVGIIGLITSQTNDHQDLPIDPADVMATQDPLTAFAKVWATVEKRSDIQVVLSQLRDDEVDRLTMTYPGIDLVLGGPDWKMGSERAPRAVNGVPCAKVGVFGKYLGRVNLELDSADHRKPVTSFDGDTVQIGEELPRNPKVEQVLEEFKAQLRRGDAIQSEFGHFLADAQHVFGGEWYCSSCHAAISNGWQATAHAHALQSLADKSQAENPACLQCHTVGFQVDGGYAPATTGSRLANVQCESCHGPGAEHMKLASDWVFGPSSPKPADWKIAKQVPEAVCVRCHNAENDPHWAGDPARWPYAELMNEIRCTHWGDARVTDAWR